MKTLALAVCCVVAFAATAQADESDWYHKEYKCSDLTKAAAGQQYDRAEEATFAAIGDWMLGYPKLAELDSRRSLAFRNMVAERCTLVEDWYITKLMDDMWPQEVAEQHKQQADVAEAKNRAEAATREAQRDRERRLTIQAAPPLSSPVVATAKGMEAVTCAQYYRYHALEDAFTAAVQRLVDSDPVARTAHITYRGGPQYSGADVYCAANLNATLAGAFTEYLVSARSWAPGNRHSPPAPGMLQSKGAAHGFDDTSLNAVQAGAIGEKVRDCWTRDAGALHTEPFRVHLTITTDASGVARQAEIAPGDPAASFGSPLHASAERAVRAVLAAQCSALPLPPSMMGEIHRFEFIFKP